MAISPVSARVEQRVIIQYSNTWPTSEASWVTVPNYIPNAVSESLGNELGSATFVQYLGSVLPIGKKVYFPTVLTAADAVADQAYVRVGVETSDGEIKVDPDSGPAVDALGNPLKDRYTAIHYGRVLKRAFSASEEIGLVAGITTAGLGIVLDQIFLPSGLVIGAAAGVGILGGELGPFNPGGFGNKSLSTVNYGTAKVYAIQPYSLLRWLASDVFDTVVAILNQRQSIIFEIDPQSKPLMDYSDSWDFRGMNVSQIFSTLANNRRGTSWKPVYIADPSPRIRIVFDSYLPGTSTITIKKTDDDTQGQDYIVKPATVQQTLNLVPASRLPQNADHRVTACALTQDARGCYDEIILVSARRMRTMAVEFKSDDSMQLVKGWTAADEAAWDAAASTQSIQASPKLDHVWRSFKFKGSWDGTDRGGSQISNYLLTSTQEPYGAGYGETGDWGPGPYFNGVTGPFFQPLRMTGVWQGVNFNSAITQAEIDSLSARDRQQPPIPPYLALSDGAGNYTPITGSANEMSITVDQETGCVVLGNGPVDAFTIKGWATSNLRMVLTLGVGLPYPVRVSWKANATPSRTLVLRTSSVESTLAPDTMLGIENGVIKTNTNELVLERCASRMRAVLALMKLWYASQEQTLTYSISGLVSPWGDNNAPPPGVLITTAIIPQGTFVLNQVVTRREWNFVGIPNVTITTARVLPSVDSFL